MDNDHVSNSSQEISKGVRMRPRHFDSSRFRSSQPRQDEEDREPIATFDDELSILVNAGNLKDLLNLDATGLLPDDLQIRVDNLEENNLKHRRTGFGIGLSHDDDINELEFSTARDKEEEESLGNEFLFFDNSSFFPTMATDTVDLNFNNDSMNIHEFTNNMESSGIDLEIPQQVFNGSTDGPKLDNRTSALMFVLLSSLLNPLHLNRLRIAHSHDSYEDLPQLASFSPEIPSEAFPFTFNAFSDLNANALTTHRQPIIPFRNKFQALVNPSPFNFITRQHFHTLEDSDEIDLKELRLQTIDVVPPPGPLVRFFHHLEPPPKPINKCQPDLAPVCPYADVGFCLENADFIQSDIENLIERNPKISLKYADVTEQSADDLVDYLSKEQEQHFDYTYFQPSSYDKTHWLGPEGYICPSTVLYEKPSRAKNVKGEWKIIVNDGEHYFQTLRLEICLYPRTPCRLVASCFKSQCLQKYSYHRLLSYDPCDSSRGLHIDVFRLPISCSCYAPEFQGFDHFEHLLIDDDDKDDEDK